MASQVLSLSVGALAQGASRRPSRAASRARDCAMPSLTNEGRRVVANATTLETKGFMGRSLCAIAPYSGAGRICARALKSFAVVASGADDLPSLNALPLAPVINTEGLILPKFKRGCKATIFAILDDKKKVQYIGFSKDIRGTLRTMMGRQPKLCYFYKSVDFMEVDQKRMLAIRSAWFSDLGSMPPGNEPIRAKYWEQPIDAGATSDRGKEQAAKHQLKYTMIDLEKRGVLEEFIPDPAMIMDGKVDFLPAPEISDADLDAMYERAALAESRTRAISIEIAGKAQEYTIYYKEVVEVTGGMIFDIKVMADEVETTHRVMVGRDYYGDDPKVAEQMVEKTIAILFYKKTPRQTQGTLKNQYLCVNYFSLSNVSQFYTDYEDLLDSPLRDQEHCWQFRRTEAYGLKKHDEAQELLYLKGEDEDIIKKAEGRERELLGAGQN